MYKKAPIELKFTRDNPCDILNTKTNTVNPIDETGVNYPYDILSTRKYKGQILRSLVSAFFYSPTSRSSFSRKTL